MIPESLVSYGTANNGTSGSRLPKWTINFPHHPRRTELIQQYETARLKYHESIEVLQFSITRQSQLTDSQKAVEIDGCQQRVEVAREELQQAEQQLRNFNDRTPEQRIGLIQLELGDLQVQLLDAHAAEQEYTNQLINDPNLNKRKLERLVFGHTGVEAEYSAEQLNELRLLRGRVQSIQGKIINAQRDVERIRELVAQEQRKAQIQTAMDVALPKFNDACTRFNDAWAELQSVAAEHGIRVVCRALQIPSEATFKQSNNPYEGNSTINILFTPK